MCCYYTSIRLITWIVFFCPWNIFITTYYQNCSCTISARANFINFFYTYKKCSTLAVEHFDITNNIQTLDPCFSNEVPPFSRIAARGCSVQMTDSYVQIWLLWDMPGGFFPRDGRLSEPQKKRLRPYLQR